MIVENYIQGGKGTKKWKQLCYAMLHTDGCCTYFNSGTFQATSSRIRIFSNLTLSLIGTLFPSTEHEQVSHYTEEVCDSLDQSESYNYSVGASMLSDTTTRVVSRNSSKRLCTSKTPKTFIRLKLRLIELELDQIFVE